MLTNNKYSKYIIKNNNNADVKNIKILPYTSFILKLITKAMKKMMDETRNINKNIIFVLKDRY